MSEPVLDVLLVAAALLLIGLNAFFVASEFALVSVRKTRIEELISQGNATARTVKALTQNPERFIAATQLGVTIASLGLGWIGEPAIARLLEPEFGFIPDSVLSRATAGVIATIVAFVVITFMHVVIGELTPKSISLGYPEQAALVVAAPMMFFINVFRPATWALNGAGNWLMKSLGLNRPGGHQQVHSSEELKMLVNTSAAGGELEPVEREFAQRAFEFADTQVSEVMIPRTGMRAVEDTAKMQDFLDLFLEISHSRFPVYSGSLDNIVGFMWVKDVLRALAKNSDARTQPIKPLMRTPLYVPETKEIGALFGEMQRAKAQMAIVLDEYGGTAGMVTIEELIEEVVGSVSDELAASVPQLRRIEDGQIEADALMSVDEANAQLGIELPESDDYETLAGMVMTRMGRVPKEGDTVRIGNLKLTVAKMQGPKLEKILLAKMSDKKS